MRRQAGCPFCSIIAKDVQARHVDIDVAGFAAFHDHKPQSRTHVIVASREHIKSFADGALHADSRLLAESITRAVWDVARVLRLSRYRMIVNNGIGRVDHMHAHIISEQKVKV